MNKFIKYLKFIIIRLGVAFIFISVLYFFNNDEIERGEIDLYNSIPNIKVYASDELLKNRLIIDGRTPQQILARGKFIIPKSSSGKIVREYYKNELAQYGWKEKIEKIIDKNNLHYGDNIVFENGVYEISLNIYPPIDNNWSEAEKSIYLGNRDPYYNIYVEKIRMF